MRWLFAPKNEVLPSVVLNPPRYFSEGFEGSAQPKLQMPVFEYEVRLRPDGGFEYTGNKSIKKGT
jgi:hypothetical protein